mgnify:CR=1 FL=1
MAEAILIMTRVVVVLLTCGSLLIVLTTASLLQEVVVAALTPVVHREATEAIRLEAGEHRVVPILAVVEGTRPVEELVEAIRDTPVQQLIKAECIVAAPLYTQEH